MSAVLQKHELSDNYNPNVFSYLTNYPWLILQDQHERVHYQFDGIAEFFGETETEYDGIGLGFVSRQYFKPGDRINIGIPLPDSIHHFQAEVVTSNKKGGLYETGIFLQIESENDLLTLLRSNDYLNIRHTS